VAEGEVLRDAIGIRVVHGAAPTQGATALAALGLIEMPSAGAGIERLSARRDFETLGDGFARFDAFGTTHKILSVAVKKSAQYRKQVSRKQAVISRFRAID
jgi:hypothetical protein